MVSIRYDVGLESSSNLDPILTWRMKGMDSMCWLVDWSLSE